MKREHVELWQIMISSSLRYFIFAGITYCIFYVWRKRQWNRFKIQESYPEKQKIQQELNYSLSTIFIFATFIYTFLFSPVRSHTFLYYHVNDYSLVYFIISPLLITFLHDTYFYWMHRFMHLKAVYPYIHRVHHQSHNPTPLAAFAFHPFEAVLEIAFLPLVLFIVPFHHAVVGLFSLYMIIMNVIGHLGHELYPRSFMTNKFLRLFNTSTHHNMHHHYGRNNYGLYFNIWDMVMKTNHPAYEEQFMAVTEKAKKISTADSMIDKNRLLAE